MTDSKGPRPRVLGTCPTCGQAFELSLRVCPTHRVALQDLAPRPTEPASLFDESDVRTDLDRTMLGAEVAATLPGAPASASRTMRRLAALAREVLGRAGAVGAKTA